MLKSAAERELRAKDFVFAEQKKENPNRRAKICNGSGVLVRRVCGRLHEGSADRRLSPYFDFAASASSISFR